MSERTISIHYLKALLTTLQNHGVDAQPLLDKYQITGDQLAENTGRVSYELFVTFTRFTWKQLGDENLGFSSKKLPSGAFYYASKLAIGAENLGEALALFLGFYNYIDHGVKITHLIDHEQDDVYIQIEMEDAQLDSEHLLAEFMLAVLHRFCCWLTGKYIELKSINFNYAPPSHQAEYALLFSGPKNFNTEQLSLRFGAQHLKDAVVKNSLELSDYIAVVPLNVIVNPVSKDNYTAKVKSLIEQQQGPEYPNFDCIAKALHMVPKTLRQKLKSEGVTYQKIKDVMRRDRAIYCLYQPNYSIADIAEKVGFTETGAFIRAFKKWTGVTPGVYRSEYVEPQ